MSMISASNITPSQFPKPQAIRNLFLIVCFMLVMPLHAQKSEGITLESAIQSALLRNPEITNDSTRKVIVIQMTKTWYNWLYTINTVSFLNEYRNLLSDIDRIAQLRYEAGDIDYIQYVTSNDILALIKTNEAIFENKSQQYKNTLCAYAFIESGIHPADSSIDLYEITKNPGTEFFPDSDSIGLYHEFAKNLEIDNIQLELDNLFIKLRYYRLYGLNFARGIRETAIARLRSEEIEYLEYAAYMERSLKIQLEFLEVLNQYNQCAIQLEEYAY